MFTICQCYWVQVPSALSATWQAKVEARNTTSFEELADWEDGTLMSQNNHLAGVWTPGSLTEPEMQWGTKVKGTVKRDRQWGSKVFKKGHQSCKVSLGMGQPVKGMCSFLWTGSDYLTGSELNKGTYSFFFLNLRFYSFTYFNFLAVVSLHCCTCAFSSCSRQGLLFVVVPGLFTAVVSLVVKHRLGIGKAPGLQ